MEDRRETVVVGLKRGDVVKCAYKTPGRVANPRKFVVEMPYLDDRGQPRVVVTEIGGNRDGAVDALYVLRIDPEPITVLEGKASLDLSAYVMGWSGGATSYIEPKDVVSRGRIDMWELRTLSDVYADFVARQKEINKPPVVCLSVFADALKTSEEPAD